MDLVWFPGDQEHTDFSKSGGENARQVRSVTWVKYLQIHTALAAVVTRGRAVVSNWNRSAAQLLVCLPFCT